MEESQQVRRRRSMKATAGPEHGDGVVAGILTMNPPWRLGDGGEPASLV